MKINITDAGRISCGYSNEKLDCVVRALAAAMDIPYYQAHDIFKAYGRKDCHKSYFTIETLKWIGLSGQFCHISLDLFIKLNPKGNFFVTKRGHAFAVKDGIVFDTVKLGGKTKVKWFAKI